jgi:outer membrane protein, adhesin transport system
MISKYLNDLYEDKILKLSFHVLVIGSVFFFCKDTLAVENIELSKKLELFDAIGIATSQHPEVISKNLLTQSEQNKLESKKWERYPSLNVETSRSPEGLNGNSYRIQVPVWDFGRISYDIEASKSAIESSKYSTEDSKLNLQEKVINAFIAISKLKEKIKVAETNILEHERLRGIIERRVQSEINPLADLSLANTRLSQSLTEKSQYEALMENNFLVLEEATGTKVNDIYPLPKIKNIKNEEEILNLAVEFSPKLKKLQAELLKADHEISSKKSALIPRIVAKYEDITNPYTGFRFNQVALVFVYDSGSGLSALSALDESKSKRESLKYSMDVVRRGLEEDIKSKSRIGKIVGQQLINYKNYSETSSIVKDSYLRQFTIGKKNWIELLNAQKEEIQSKYQFIDISWEEQQIIYHLFTYAGGSNYLKNYFNELKENIK